MPSAVLSNMLRVPAQYVLPEHTKAYTYLIKSSEQVKQDHLPPTCLNCSKWGLRWRKPDGGTCADRGYKLSDTCRQYSPKVLREEQEIEVLTWKREGDEYLFPRGDLGKLDKVFHDFHIDDKRAAPALGYDLQMKEGHSLYPHQQVVYDQWARYKYGLIEAPTGWGKSVLECFQIVQLGVRTLVLAAETTHIKVLYEALYEHTNIEDLEKEAGCAIVGILNEETKFKPSGTKYTRPQYGAYYPITLTTFQALNSDRGKKLLPELADKFGFMLLEEPQHEAAETFHTVSKTMNCYYRSGATATPTRGDRMECVIYDTIGPIVAIASQKAAIPKVQFIHTQILVPDSCFKGMYVWSTVASHLASNRTYFDRILDQLNDDFKAGRKVLLYSMRKSFNRKLQNSLKLMGWNVEVLDSDNKKIKEQSWYSDQLAAGELHGLVGTSMIKEGFNVPILDCLHLPFPNFTEQNELQVVGRVLRENVANKPQPLIRVYTWDSHQNAAHKATNWRRSLYKRLGYDVESDIQVGSSMLDVLQDF